MKKHLSVFSLYIRASLVPMILLLLVTSVIQGGMFFYELKPYMNITHPGDGAYILGLETIFSRTLIPHTALVSVILLTILLAIQGTAFSSKTEYTMKRLSVSEKAAFLWQAGYNSLAFLLFWAVEGVLMYVLCSVYSQSIGNATGQTLLLALYRDEFLHGMVPLHDVSRIVRNAVFCLTFGTMTAYYTHTQRNGRASIALVPTALYAIGAFCMGDISLSTDIAHIVVCLLFSAAVIVKILTDFDFLAEDEKADTKEHCKEENSWNS